MLLYQADLYAGMTRDKNLYGEKKVRIPAPRFVIFYNGEKEQPDRQVLKLSDLYEVKDGYGLELEAVERAITECIREGILEEFLRKNRAEAKRMSIYEYDQVKHIRQEREDAWEEGRQEGRQEGIAIGRDLGREESIRELITRKQAKGKTIREIAEDLEMSEEEVLCLAGGN